MIKASVDTTTFSLIFRIKAYVELCKPRVVALMLLTSLVGMLLATNTWISFSTFIFGNLGIALTAAAGAVINHLLDHKIDSAMSRTKNRPIPIGTVAPHKALLFAFILAFSGLGILFFYINILTALLTFLTFLGYAVIYTVFLKHLTPQNIVIGGAAGAMPPVLGWTAVTNHIDPNSLLLFLIIFVWTPPHFWALAIHREKEYALAKIPMLPVTHGIEFTKTSILLYTFLLFAVSLLPFAAGMSGILYLAGSLLLNARFCYWALKLRFNEKPLDAIKTFRYSIIYLMLLFGLLLVDHFIS